MLLPVEFPPGLYRKGTRYQSRGRWYDGELIRWHEGRMRPIGGWGKISTEALAGIPRAMHSWRSNSDIRYLGIGTAGKLYASDGGSYIDITPAGFAAGSDTSLLGIGYGAQDFGEQDFGDARSGGSGSLVAEASLWSLDNWGERLVANASSDGKVYEWDLNPVNDAVVLSNAPTQCKGLLVTEQRHLMVLGAGGDPRKVQWSDEENNNLWTPAANNAAGSFRLETPGKLRAGRKLSGSVLLHTDKDLWLGTYVGRPYIWGFRSVGKDCGIIGPKAGAVHGDRAFWMGKNSFWLFDGYVRPLPCDVHDFIFNDINLDQAVKIVCGVNPLFLEIWWAYPSAGSNENNRYVILNPVEGHWSFGKTLARSAIDPQPIWPYPVMADTSGFVYQHDLGWLDNGSPRTTRIFAQGGPLDINDGNDFIYSTQMIPDVESEIANAVQFSFTSRETPNGPETNWGPWGLEASGYVDARFSGRQVQMKVEALVDGDWSLGRPRFEVEGMGGQ